MLIQVWRALAGFAALLMTTLSSVAFGSAISEFNKYDTNNQQAFYNLASAVVFALLAILFAVAYFGFSMMQAKNVRRTHEEQSGNG